MINYSYLFKIKCIIYAYKLSEKYFHSKYIIEDAFFFNYAYKNENTFEIIF